MSNEELTRLRDENEALKADAERYRFLREYHHDWKVDKWLNEPACFSRYDGSDLDAAIDAARGK